MAESVSDGKPNLAATSWALLGMLSYEHELSGYDIRKWIEWSMRFFYGSPAYSQIYAELKKLEKLGLVTSRVENTGGTRNRRLYKITPAGLEAVQRWAKEDPVDHPVLKHPALLRVAFGHMTDPERLKEILQDHVAYADEMARSAAKDAKWAGAHPSWAYAKVALQWAERYYASERELALTMLKELDEAEATFAEAGIERGKPIPWPAPDYWYEIEQKAGLDD
ncbi:PadR family transcriptional regulator [Mycolicibacterium phlei]|jgi:DNA-binding PadR family transcriptional regulator|uniref:PadR family transcriptional regulator n=1 Tax=Mycolicibacterium phlei DSM 43239 = CCUG 21000 TaxID=1226750 RepID=A0A5N5V041_MYCPH|nr:PadR family transcriptional regulator [Mycolicibacterium phlei]VEG09528.1 putative transcriptional regulator [Mycobacteroides chelonae]AMO61414.1 Transcriptional regulator PadR-like family protein [Mycolicibacterium phlei]EID15422.1 putative transcriptional regulator [Mycolicibacterium phlei RIVM601174]KAB7755255.1 PadR family transcriptional regulator [Mycolicibacterium phlei DSM 43239 = CCUG 21000]KXW64701.1 PadR family transcriptional regulator [Mycolicibacterium phlei DSM 43239 = CCUG 2